MDIMAAEHAVRQAVAEGAVPGAVLAVGFGGSLLTLRSWGHLRLKPDKVAVRHDTLFDLASLTKVVAVWPLVIELLQQEKLTLATRLADALPAYAIGEDKANVTIRHLLCHTAGFVPFHDTVGESRQQRVQSLLDIPLDHAPGNSMVYSDLSFIMLGEIVAHATGMPLHKAVHRKLASFGMRKTAYRLYPPKNEEAYNIAATEVYGDKVTAGYVHDERAQQLDGAAGHAGLFGTAADLALMMSALLGAPRHPAFQSPFVAQSFEPQPAAPSRGLAWQLIPKPAGGYLVGHTGFTGTSLLFDPESRAWQVLLTNRVHLGRDNMAHVPLRQAVCRAIFNQDLT